MNLIMDDRARVRALQAAATLASALLVVLVMVSSASAAFSITGFSMSSTSSVAGAHPDMTTEITFSTTSPGPDQLVPNGNVRDLDVNLPAGLAGDSTAVPRCPQVDFAAGTCPAASQIGVSETALIDFPGSVFHPIFPVYLMEPRNEEETAEIAFQWPGILAVQLPVSVRTDGDYGLTVHATAIPKGYRGIASTKLTIWGVPGDPSHDSQRLDGNGFPVGPGQVARIPFLINPSRCDGPLIATARANSYQDSSTYSTATTSLPQLTGCDGQPFDAKLSFEPSTSEAGVPAGYTADLTVAQNKNPTGVSAANLRTAKVTLPPGVTITPGGAAGLGACDDADLHIGSTASAACPDVSRIGEVTIDVPVLPKPIHGRVYLRRPLPGNLFRIVIVADDFGVHLKIPGDVRPDKVTGQITTTFSDAPQLPFSKMSLTFDGGPHAPLSNPPACGTYTTHAELTPWSSTTPVSSDSSFTIDRGCGQENAFAPGFSAGMDDKTAGAYSTFRLRITRGSVGSAISTIDTALPGGLLANIASVPRCPEAQAAAGTCGSQSVIGKVIAGAGPGTSPLFVPQPGKTPTAVFLAGPYKGAPFSLSIVVPAEAGPFSLGNVVVRAGLYVDPVTARATVRAEPMPTILEGVPLNVRDIRVIIDRPGFTFNPTSCDPQQISGTVTSAAGQAVAVSSPFQVADCDRLDLAPRIALALSGKGQTTDGKHPAVTASLTQPGGQSNLKKVAVALPLSLALDPDNANGLCEFVDGSKPTPTCPKASIVGSATAVTPILGQPLTGPVYFVKNIRKDPKSGREIRTLPKLVIPLEGENSLKLTLTGTSNVVDDQLVTTFDQVPDAPVTSFKLNIVGGKGGILTVSGADICKATQIAEQQVEGQNGKQVDTDIYIQTPSCALKVLSKKVGMTSVAVKVGGLGAGKATVSGKGIKKTTKTITRSTVATITAKRTKAKPGRVTVSFDPVGPAKARKTTK